jgi:hypothetical protein
MSQLRFGWAVPIEPSSPAEDTGVDLDEETTRAAVALMARVLIAVVRAAEEEEEENADDR